VSRSQPIDANKAAELDLVRKHRRQLEALEADQQRERQHLEAQQRERRRALQARHVRELVQLWRAQGRQLGPWTTPILEGELPRAFPREGKVGHG